ncbi:MAG: hypothetical protein A2942_04305 [Candidatus Lloydbacteria bacterium RIFCSPLOWO2_01_FULL_50_20]|uniref:NadR/Ttd14 AAA domain-containing protein n=1 Tax=Candidatus Lloydbacteria bacterium RIFCSPLOWO2_01_FULL_50_20 TaxID=1798665 RepID=A0A1G2DER2_9BACT|nr:MAG: hypothetical protein A3C13_04500 [Candidatus Lloydbacteria bacterium RIFCSPHIGHO2_02_FULL_50_11]OGZ11441.1 MAG: hypothetical protein A2942_04305 [Candidatus Lloydbacteria bacterium RIFCSPLOWO2_01_FULL_50_20]
MNITKLVLTGGPCAGKTTALEFLADRLRASGYYPLIVHEAATAVLSTGLTYLDANGDWFPFQRAVIQQIISSEDILEQTLRRLSYARPILICDRGIMDSKAYMTASQFQRVIEACGLRHPAKIRNGRYDAVIHMRSTAIGAEEFYSSKTNVHRRETIAEATVADERTLAVWLGHQHLAVVGNTYGDFAGKLEAVWKSACRLLGIPKPREIEKKFLVEPVDFTALGIPHETVDIEQYYLELPDQEKEVIARIRSWGKNGAETHTFTQKRTIVPGEVEEIEEHISEMVFAQYTKYQKRGTIPLCKRRTCFVYNDQYFMYDEFLTGRPGLMLLEIELESQESNVTLPPFVRVRKDVTLKREYSNSMIAVSA